LEEIDEAFNWLILIMSTINGILIGLPETIEAKKAVAGWLIPPFFMLAIVWLLSHLIKRSYLKAILKTYAWFNALFILLLFSIVFSEVTYGFTLQRVSQVFPLLLIPWFVFWLVGPFIFFDLLIRPIYKETYKDSRLLTSRKRLVSLYILALATFLTLTLPYFLLGAHTPFM